MIIAGLLLFIPISLILAYGLYAAPLWIFASAGLAIIPVADWIRRATDQLAGRTGPSIGGLVNVTFGSIAELILALFVLSRGHTAVVKAQITGSLIGTSLLARLSQNLVQFLHSRAVNIGLNAIHNYMKEYIKRPVCLKRLER